MIGVRKPSGHIDLGVEDLAFYYDEMVRCRLLELEVETPNGKIVLRRQNRGLHLQRRKTDPAAEGIFESASPPFHAAAAPETPTQFKTIKSPIIGVFYRASSPQSAPFVKEGDLVEPGATVCLVEAMKVMNEIKADCRCRIIKIFIENTKPVTRDQPLFHVDPVA